MLNAKFTAVSSVDSDALIPMLTRRLPMAIAGAVGGLLAVAATFNQFEPWPALESMRWFPDIVLPFMLGSLAGVVAAYWFERLDPARAFSAQ